MGRFVPSDPVIKANWLFVPFTVSKAATRQDRDTAVQQASAWCNENAHGRWSNDYKSVTVPNTRFPQWQYGFFFKGPNDALLFKLTWTGHT